MAKKRYGFGGDRYAPSIRWTGRLQALLGDKYCIVEEGCNGRTTVFDDPIEGGHESGLIYLPPCVMSHSPLDLIIIMLGSNDLKKRFGMTAFTIGGGLTALVKAARTYAMNAEGVPPKILLIAPPPVRDNIMETRHAPIFGEESIEVSRQLGPELMRVAKLMRCEFMDAAPYCELSRADAVHMTREDHLKLAEAVCAKVRSII